MAASINSLLDLEQRRLELERTVHELEKSLRHWRSWEAEYEGFADELRHAGSDPAPSEIEELAASFGGDVFTEAEYSALIKDKGGAPRTAQKILDLMRHRLDWFKQNVQHLEKRLETASSTLGALDAVVDAQPRDEDGLPLQEIFEELDEDDNVISSSVSNHNEAAPEVLDALRKKGVKGIPAPPASTTRLNSGAKELRGKESDAQPSLPASKPDSHMPQLTNTPMANGDKSTLKSAVHRDVETSLAKDASKAPPMPDGESPEENALRRDMLEYNMNEIGAIVAEMDMNDDGEWSGSSMDEDEDDEQPEDEFGRTSVPVISDAYRQEMLKLEQKLSARYLANAGPKADLDTAAVAHSLEDNAASVPASTKPEISTASSEKKGVRFADSLDLQSPPTSPKPNTPPAEKTETPVSDSIVERDGSEKQQNEPPKPKATSTFMAKRAAARSLQSSSSLSRSAGPVVSGPLAGMNSSLAAVKAQSAPLKIVDPDSEPDWNPRGPPGKTHADTLVENPRADHAEVREPHELDADILQREVAEQYHKMRNRFIQQEGGFTQTEEDSEDEDAPQMSRFMAARLSQAKR